MPVISKFYGIVIRMLSAPEFPPRFHAFYGDWELVVGIDPVRVIQGEAPFRARAMVLAWASAHRRELLAAWNRINGAQVPEPIQPLV